MHVLLAWQAPGVGARLAELAEHPDSRLRRPILEFLGAKRYPEAVNAFHRVVRTGPTEDVIFALRALGTIGNDKARRVLVSLRANAPTSKKLYHPFLLPRPTQRFFATTRLGRCERQEEPGEVESAPVKMMSIEIKATPASPQGVRGALGARV